MFNSLKYSSGSLNYFLSFVTSFLLCSAVAVCSDVLASLSYVRIVGYIAVGLLAIVFLTWLVLYLSSSKPVSQVDIERTYYKTKIKTLLNSSNQLTQAEIKILDLNIATWVILNEFRVKLYNRISRYGK